MAGIESKGTKISFKGSVQVLAMNKLGLEEVRGLMESALLQPFSTDLKNKTLQEMIIYGLYQVSPTLNVGKIKTYEWGDNTIITQCLWDVIVSSLNVVTRSAAGLSHPQEMITTTSAGSSKVITRLEIVVSPLSVPQNRVGTNRPGLIYPTMGVPEIIRRYRESHSNRAIGSALKGDKGPKDVV
nr:TPA_asm: P3 [Medicago trirhavirus 1]